jgi:hypothetical protein
MLRKQVLSVNNIMVGLKRILQIPAAVVKIILSSTIIEAVAVAEYRQMMRRYWKNDRRLMKANRAASGK